MNIYLRLIISFAVGVTIAAVSADPGKENYNQVVAIWGYMVSMFVFSPISLYSSDSREIEKDLDGNAVPRFLRVSRLRENVGKWSLLATLLLFFVFLAVALIFSPEYSYIFFERFEVILLGSATLYSPIGIYFFLTRKCAYCGLLNEPKNNTCRKCNYDLPAHIMDKYIDKATE